MTPPAPSPLTLSFVVPGPPVPWERVTPLGGGRAYMPQRTREYQHRCAWRAQLALRGTAWRTDAVYALHLLVVFPDRRRRDLSNVVKSVEDGLNGVVWADDSQIAELHVVRDYSKDSPRVEVRVELLSIPGQA